MRHNHDELMEAIWEATVACCVALHDIGLIEEEIAAEMPKAQKQLGSEIIERCFPFGQRYNPLLSGDAIKIGQDYAEKLAARRAGRVA